MFGCTATEFSDPVKLSKSILIVPKILHNLREKYQKFIELLTAL